MDNLHDHTLDNEPQEYLDNSAYEHACVNAYCEEIIDVCHERCPICNTKQH